MKLLVCGSRDWADAVVIWRWLEPFADKYPDAEVIHGAARGADTLAAQAAEALHLKVIAVPAEWEKFGKAAGPMRNKVMLGMAPDQVVAFRSNGKSSGTDHMIGLALKSRIPVVVVEPDGSGRYAHLNQETS